VSTGVHCTHTFTLRLGALLSLDIPKGESGGQMSFISSLNMFNLMKQIVCVRLQGAAGERRLLAQTETTWIYFTADSCVCVCVCVQMLICSYRWRWRVRVKGLSGMMIRLTLTFRGNVEVKERACWDTESVCEGYVCHSVAYYHYFGGMQYFTYAWKTQIWKIMCSVQPKQTRNNTAYKIYLCVCVYLWVPCTIRHTISHSGIKRRG